MLHFVGHRKLFLHTRILRLKGAAGKCASDAGDTVHSTGAALRLRAGGAQSEKKSVHGAAVYRLQGSRLAVTQQTQHSDV